MRITRRQLRKIIQEEVRAELGSGNRSEARLLNEGVGKMVADLVFSGAFVKAVAFAPNKAKTISIARAASRLGAFEQDDPEEGGRRIGEAFYDAGIGNKKPIQVANFVKGLLESIGELSPKIVPIVAFKNGSATVQRSRLERIANGVATYLQSYNQEGTIDGVEEEDIIGEDDSGRKIVRGAPALAKALVLASQAAGLSVT